MKKQLFSLLVTLVVLNSCIFTNEIEPEDNSNTEYNSVYNLVSNLFLYPEQIKESNAYNFDIDALFADTDQFSGYYNPLEAQALLTQFSTPEKVGLVGVTVTPIEEGSDTLIIGRVFPDSPAEKVGVLKGDKILEVNGHSVITQDSMDKWNVYVSGGVGTEVSFKILREEEVLDFNMVKEEIQVPTVWVDSIQEKISLIQITQFSVVTNEEDIKNSEGANDTLGTWREFREALTKTASDEVTLLDLRGNPGGAIVMCEAMADELVAEDQILYLSDDRTTVKVDTVLATKDGLGEQRKFVMLADDWSASCAELFIAAVLGSRDINLVGVKTYGKGIGQSFHWTFEEGLAKITSLGLSNNKSITWNKVGIEPSHSVEGVNAQLEKAVSLAEEMSIQPLEKVNFQIEPTPLSVIQAKLSERLAEVTDVGGAYKLPKSDK